MSKPEEKNLWHLTINKQFKVLFICTRCIWWKGHIDVLTCVNSIISNCTWGNNNNNNKKKWRRQRKKKRKKRNRRQTVKELKRNSKWRAKWGERRRCNSRFLSPRYFFFFLLPNQVNFFHCRYATPIKKSWNSWSALFETIDKKKKKHLWLWHACTH